ncbi:uncharacterized protein LOC135515461 [Oncorhynchus masou masou]|uniref:uncharacterized protein LOC135515461 n=1 Tax=Oncorhynchus masou masou TaxID=90313 RepID=UPI003183D904
MQTDIKLLANCSCTVRLVCNVSCYPNITYTWERDNEMYGDAQQIYFSLSPAERNISVKCNASNLVIWKTAFETGKCSNDTPPTGLVWYTLYIGISVGGAVVLILTVAVAVCYCRGRSNTEDLIDNTIYVDVMDNTIIRDTRSNSHVNPISTYETVNDLVIPRLNKLQTLYDKITFGCPEGPPSPYQEVLTMDWITADDPNNDVVKEAKETVFWSGSGNGYIAHHFLAYYSPMSSLLTTRLMKSEQDSMVKKAQRRLFNNRRQKKCGLSPKALTNFYRCTIKSILSGCIIA